MKKKGKKKKRKRETAFIEHNTNLNKRKKLIFFLNIHSGCANDSRKIDEGEVRHIR
jgi:hypothetical protein